MFFYFCVCVSKWTVRENSSLKMDGWCNLVAGAGMRDVGSSPIPSTLLILLKKVSTHLFTRGRATVETVCENK